MRPLLVLIGAWFAAPLPAAEPVDFARDVLPILSDNCFKCHGPDANTRKAKLRLDVQEEALRTESPVVVPHKAGDSELYRRISSTDEDVVMPPPRTKQKLTPAQIDVLKRWIDQGAPWGRHWAFVPPTRPELPKVNHAGWPRNGIDHFVLHRLEKEGLQPSPEADRRTHIRRVTLDLTGLPPTPEQFDAFLADKSPDAYERVVDRLLASPRFGERMAWDWLDAARYADSNGYQGDGDRTMWPWRDWVVNAFNANVPYDQFTIEQLAGDLLPNATRDQKLATGFHRNHMINGEGGRIPAENRAEYVMDQAETTATVWLGLTMTCCRCHDHKFDPITQKEYYQLFAFFNQTPVDGGGGSGQTKPVIDFATPEHLARQKVLQERVGEVGMEVDALEKELFPREEGKPAAASAKAADLSGNLVAALQIGGAARGVDFLDEMINVFKDKDPAYVKLLKKLREAVANRNGFNNSIPRVMVMEDMPKRRDTFVLTRGAYDKSADKVEAGMPACVATRAKAEGDPATQPLNRLDLARWLVDRSNPLTARVTVNRYWQTVFGTGLVKSVEDFGVQGEKPSHPELLDWLAVEFVNPSPQPSPQGGEGVMAWDLKRLVKLMVSSTTYRQSSKVTPQLLERDPENWLLARSARQRLPSWMIRDQALAVSGLLAGRMGGPSVRPYQPPGIWEEATFGKIQYRQDHGEALYRRSLYVFWRRIIGPTTFFDNAARQVCTIKPFRTNTPLHALTTLNDVTYVEAARVLGERMMEEGGATPRARIAYAYRWVLGRQPTEAEAALLERRLAGLREHFAQDRDATAKLLQVGEAKRSAQLEPAEHAAYAALAQVLLNLDETLTRQ